MPEFLLRQSGTWKALVFKGFDADRDQSGTKKTWKKIKKVSTCAAATVAKGFFAVTRSKWKSCVFFEALERLEVLNFPAFARHHNLVVCLTGRAARQTPRCTCGLFGEWLKRNSDFGGRVKTGPRKHCAGLRHLREAAEEQLCIDEDKKVNAHKCKVEGRAKPVRHSGSKDNHAVPFVQETTRHLN